MAANLGVIAGIIFLALEVNQNNLLMESQTRANIASQISNQLYQSAESDYLEIFTSENFDGLTQLEITRRNRYLQSNLRMWENIHYQYRNGLYDESEFIKEREVWRNAVNGNMRFIICNSQTSNLFSEEFFSELESLLDQAC